MEVQHRHLQRDTPPLQQSLTRNLIQGALAYLLTAIILMLAFSLNVLAFNASDPAAQTWFKQILLGLTLVTAAAFAVFHSHRLTVLIPALITGVLAATATNNPVGLHLGLTALVLAQQGMRAPHSYGLMLSVIQTCGALMLATTGLAVDAALLLPYLLLTVALRRWTHPALHDPRLIVTLAAAALALSLR
ncbi:hypothetical protein [Deinococcus ficus]|uniref:Uncharacterized protein n=1 Tax=Deinococcus ficus TaxID=317577 RepID=A0A221T2U6_9DEIO|nr:hypothetical protein [Deinococcus ficus]ASN83247.1 hypothetical protein DFI_18795 [Deinococcus ficus]